MPLVYVLGSQHTNIHMGQEAELGTQIRIDLDRKW